MSITRDNIIGQLRLRFPVFEKEIDSASGVYEALGNVAISLAEKIENRNIDESIIKAAVKLIDELATNQDPEVRNMLVVGIFETMSNFEFSMDYIKRKIGEKSIHLYDEYLSE